uniref:Uncharacterized protein n=1 Tax=Meloidogyne incognita TaxID=6306 RepID=A0A914N1G8_MELIC
MQHSKLWRFFNFFCHNFKGDVWTSRNSNSEPNEYIEGLEDGSLKVVTKKFPPLVQLLELFFFCFGGSNTHLILNAPQLKK